MPMSDFENPETIKSIKSITAHYISARGIERSDNFSTIADYLKWEKSVKAKGYDINRLDIFRHDVIPDAIYQFREENPTWAAKIDRLLASRNWDTMADRTRAWEVCQAIITIY